MIVVSPYRPFAPESREHLELGPFDWRGALAMLAHSARRSCDIETVALTDLDTDLPVPAFRYAPTESRLMLWILEVFLRYLSSSDFTEDTIMVSPDTLITGDVKPYFVGDLTLLVRSAPHYADRPILNAVQWWPVKSRKKLIRLYRDALDIARGLPEPLLTWGADSEPLRQLLLPIVPGVQDRQGLKVWMLESTIVMQSLQSAVIHQLESGLSVSRPVRPIVDFKYLRKARMADYFAAIFRDPA